MSVLNRNQQLVAKQGRLDMSGHIVLSLIGVCKGEGLRANQIDGLFKVRTNVRVSVFIERQGCGRMLDEKVQKTHLKLVYLRRRIDYLVRDQVKSSLLSRQLQIL